MDGGYLLENSDDAKIVLWNKGIQNVTLYNQCIILDRKISMSLLLLVKTQSLVLDFLFQETNKQL